MNITYELTPMKLSLPPCQHYHFPDAVSFSFRHCHPVYHAVTVALLPSRDVYFTPSLSPCLSCGVSVMISLPPRHRHRVSVTPPQSPCQYHSVIAMLSLSPCHCHSVSVTPPLSSIHYHGYAHVTLSPS